MTTTTVNCICVSENRPSLFAIAMSAFYDQWLSVEVAPRMILCLGDLKQRQRYQRALDKLCLPHPYFIYEVPDGTIAERTDAAIRMAPEADVYCTWDDDDIQPCDHVLTAARMYQKGFAAWTYDRGKIINLYSLRGGELAHPWGASIAYTRKQWEAVGGFAGIHDEDLGYDQAFWYAVPEQKRLLLTPKRGMPIACAHDKNIATFISLIPEEKRKAFDTATLSPAVRKAVAAVHEKMVARGIVPPGTQVKPRA